jgi:hypothetical protein
VGHRTSPTKLFGSRSRLDKSGKTPLEASRESLKASHRSNKSGTTTGQVQWGSLVVGLSSLEAGHGPDKSGGGTGQVRYPSLESGKNNFGVRWFDWTSPVKPGEWDCERLSTSASHQTFLICHN